MSDRPLRLIEPEGQFVAALPPAAVQNEGPHVREIVSNVLDWICIPVFSFKNLFFWKFPITFVNIRDLQWRYWLTLLFLSYMLYWQMFPANWIQGAFNYYRSICNCDVLRIQRMSSLIEGFTIWSNHDKDQELKYFVCRAICI